MVLRLILLFKECEENFFRECEENFFEIANLSDFIADHFFRRM